MRSRRIDLSSTAGEPLRLYTLSDVHLGSAMCDEAALGRWLQLIARDPHARVIILGDLIGAIGKGDKRLDLGGLAPWVREADPAFIEDVIEIESQEALSLLYPIAERIDAYIEGNHERKPRAWYGRAVGASLCRELGVMDAYLGAQGWLSYVCHLTKTQTARLNVYGHHGYSAGRALGGQVGQLERMLLSTDADIVMCGHSHSSFAHPCPRMETNAKTCQVYQRQRWGILGGTFERSCADGSDGWSDERALAPKQIGGVIVEFDPASRQSSATVVAA